MTFFSSNATTTVLAVTSPNVIGLYFDDHHPEDLLGFSIERQELSPRLSRPIFLKSSLRFAPEPELPDGHAQPLQFGKYRNSTMLEVVKSDANYVAWCLDQIGRNPLMVRFQQFCLEWIRLQNEPSRQERRHFPPISSKNAPFQDFSWFDYSVRPSTQYVYTVRAVRLINGERMADSPGIKINATTSDQVIRGHFVCFNRGVAGSRAFRRKWRSGAPLSDDDKTWLEHGLKSAIIDYIAKAQKGDQLFLAIYELSDPELASSLKEAAQNGVIVHFYYHPSERTLAYLKQDPDFFRHIIPYERKSKAGLAHCKFMVLVSQKEPLYVLTGSSNWTEGGMYGQFNVVHCVHDGTLASQYLAFWTQLAQNTEPAQLKRFTESFTPLPRELNTWQVFFCPRSNVELMDLFVKLVQSAKHCVCVACPFGIHKGLLKALTSFDKSAAPLRFILLDKERHMEPSLLEDPHNIVSVGSLYPNESTTGLNEHVEFCHVKMIIIDPLGDNPILVCGSGNFSDASILKNEENYLVLRGLKDVARMYFCEFQRVFRHWKPRWELIKQQRRQQTCKTRFLDSTSTWTMPWFQDDNSLSFLRKGMMSV